MFFYYTIWLVISLFSFFFNKKKEIKIIFFLMIAFLTFMTGLRYEVGADWYNYLAIYDQFKYLDFSSALLVTDTGYGLFNYISNRLSLTEIFLVNTLCSICFFICFYYFSKKFENYWLPLLISFPYLILVVSMGYTRQAVAISFVLMAIVYGLENNFKKHFFFVFLAFLFHKSAIIAFMFSPFFIFPNFFRNNFIFFCYVVFSFVFMSYVVYLSSSLTDNIYTEKSGDMSSAGAIFRISFHFFPMAFFLFYRKKIKIIFKSNYHFFDYMAFLILFSLMLAIPFSTLADRFNLYLIVFDIFIFSCLYSKLNYFDRQFMVGSIIILNTIMLIIWFNFGAWSHAWIPYQNYFFNFILESV